MIKDFFADVVFKNAKAITVNKKSPESLPGFLKMKTS